MSAPEAKTPPAYLLAEVDIHDPAGFTPYAQQFASTLTAFGGQVLVFGSPLLPVEGIPSSTARIALVTFPSLKAAQDWLASDAYLKIIAFRHNSSKTRAFFVEGPAA